jgi:hypothetical protein
MSCIIQWRLGWGRVCKGLLWLAPVSVAILALCGAILLMSWPSQLHWSMSNADEVNSKASMWGYGYLFSGLVFACMFLIAVGSVLMCLFLKRYKLLFPLFALAVGCLIVVVLGFLGFDMIVGRYM